MRINELATGESAVGIWIRDGIRRARPGIAPAILGGLLALGGAGCGGGGIDRSEIDAAKNELHARVDAVLAEVKGLRDVHERLKVEVAQATAPEPEAPADAGDPTVSAVALAEQLEELDQRLSSVEDRVGSQVEDLASRIAALPTVADIEQAAAANVAPPPDAADDTHIMSIESVEELPRDADALDQASALRREAKQLADRLKSLETKRDELLKRPYPHWWYWESHREERRREEMDRRRQRESLSKQIGEVRGDLRRKEGMAAAKEKAASTPRQRITGWDGARTIVLETTKDLSSIVVRSQRDGKLLGWRGKLKESDDDRQTWEVGHLSVEEQPKGFRPRR